MRSLLRISLFALVLLAVALPSAALAAGPGSTVLVSRADGLGPVPPAFDNDSQMPGSLSDDGRYAAFVSEADGFAPGADPTVENVFVRDTKTGTTTLVSSSDGRDGAGANAESADPDITVAPN